MKNRRIWQAAVVLALLAVASAPLAQGVLRTAMDSPAEVVEARKLMMKTLAGNMKDINDKIRSGQTEAVAINAASIGAVAVILPPLYKDRHDGVYPFPGSQSFFKGGPAGGIESASMRLKTDADSLRSVAEKKDAPGVQAAFDAMKPACGACHSVFRGKY
jgi:cytochrome c556